MAMTISEQIKAKRGLGGKGKVTSYTSFQENTNGSHTSPVQLSDGCLWFSLTFFSHWVIQNYNMHASLVLQIPKGIISLLCSHATPKRSYEEGF